jgi:hypothetical protein
MIEILKQNENENIMNGLMNLPQSCEASPLILWMDIG